MHHTTVRCQWKGADPSDDSGGTLTGYASTFGNVDRGGDVVMPGAFADTLADLRANGGIPLLADHVASTGSVLGTITDAHEDSHGLVITATFSTAPSAQEVRRKLLEGHVTGLSIGYEAVDYAYAERDGRTVRLLSAVRLWETSVVVFPMNPAALVSAVKTAPAHDEHKHRTDLGLWLVTLERLLAS